MAESKKLFVSNSELTAFAECPLKWHLENVARLDPPKGYDPEGQNRLDRGTAWHVIMELRARGIETGKTAEQILEKVEKWLREDLSSIWHNVQAEEFDLLMWMFEGYVETYGMDEQWEMLEHENTFEVEFPVKGAKNLVYTGRVDNVRRHRETGKVYLVDYKSKGGRDLSKDAVVNEMLLEDQFIMYSAAYQILGKPFDGVIRDVARTDRLKRPMTLEERFARIEFEYSQSTIEEVWRSKQAVAENLVATYKGKKFPFAVPDTNKCGWKCNFYKPHLESRHSGRTVEEVALGYGFSVRDENDKPRELQSDEDLSW